MSLNISNNNFTADILLKDNKMRIAGSVKVDEYVTNSFETKKAIYNSFGFKGIGLATNDAGFKSRVEVYFHSDTTGYYKYVAYNVILLDVGLIVEGVSTPKLRFSGDMYLYNSIDTLNGAQLALYTKLATKSTGMDCY
jgi:hypothetical protein